MSDEVEKYIKTLTFEVLFGSTRNELIQAAFDAGKRKGAEEEWEEILKYKPYLHFCMTAWDGLLIDEGDEEFECCQCFKDKPKRPMD